MTEAARKGKNEAAPGRSDWGCPERNDWSGRAH